MQFQFSVCVCVGGCLCFLGWVCSFALEQWEGWPVVCYDVYLYVAFCLTEQNTEELALRTQQSIPIHVITQFLKQIPAPTSVVVAPLAEHGPDTLHSYSPRGPELCKDNFKQSICQYVRSLAQEFQPPRLVLTH